MQNIRSHNGIPRRPALARAATQRYIGAQKTRSKDRRCSTVFEGHHCGCSFLQIGSYFSLRKNTDFSENPGRCIKVFNIFEDFRPE